jgi:predicted transcriptional regulator
MSDKLKEYIKTLVREMMIDEEGSTSAAVGGYLTPKAFAKKGQKSNGAIEAAEKEGMKKAPERMPSDSKVQDYKAIWGKKKKYKIYKESDYDKASPSSNPSDYLKSSPSSNPSLYLQKSPYTSENMNEEEMKKGRRFIPPTLPFNEKLLEPFELSKTKEPIRLFKLVSKGEEYILLASPFVKNALESIERGRGSIDKDRQAAYAYSANLANYLKDNLNQSARVVIKKYLQNAKPGPGGYFPINLTVTKGKNGELLIKNPVFDTSSDIASLKYESLSDIIAQELINEVTYSKFKKDVSYRTKTEMLHKGIKEVKRKLAEIDRIVEYTSRMKQELSEGEEGIKYWKTTEKNVAQIAEIVNTLNEKIKNLYQ